MLPRLQSHVRCKPQLLHFPPYNREQIVTILQVCVCVRIASLYLVLSSLFFCYLQSRVGGAGLIEPMAVQFCARKVASVHGDVRKALDICRYAHTPHTLHTPSHLTLPHRRAIEKAELDKENEATPLPLRITLRHVADVIAEVSKTIMLSDSTCFVLYTGIFISCAALLTCPSV